MTEDNAILVIAHQIGSGRALAPVIPVLQSRGRKVTVASCGLAASAFESQRIAFKQFDDSADAEELLALFRPDVVVTGTSAGTTLEKNVIEAATQHGIPTVAVLDHWSNYLLRFEGPDRIDRYYPARLAVMDATARQDLLSLGYSADAIVITGQPAFDELLQFDRRERKAAGPIVMFASEPVGRDSGTSIGYDEVDALRLLLQVAGDLPHPQPRVVIKPHPTEGVDRLAAVVADSPVAAEIIVDANPRELAFEAAAVVGMTSLLLLEAAIIGTPAISLQPNLGQADQFIGKRLGVVQSVYDDRACRNALQEALRSDRKAVASAARSALGVDGRAAARVADLVESFCLHTQPLR